MEPLALWDQQFSLICFIYTAPHKDHPRCEDTPGPIKDKISFPDGGHCSVHDGHYI